MIFLDPIPPNEGGGGGAKKKETSNFPNRPPPELAPPPFLYSAVQASIGGAVQCRVEYKQAARFPWLVFMCEHSPRGSNTPVDDMKSNVFGVSREFSHVWKQSYSKTTIIKFDVSNFFFGAIIFLHSEAKNVGTWTIRSPSAALSIFFL